MSAAIRMPIRMPIRMLILGTGGMANTHAQKYNNIDGVKLVAGVEQRPEVLEAFCHEYQIEHRFNSLDEALAWGQFDAVSNVTPDAVHFETTMALLRAGKHVLCEKPLASNETHAQQMAQLALEYGLVNMVNLTYREVPALQKAAAMVVDGAIGKVRHFEASYLQSWLTQAAWGDWQTESQWLWRLSSEHGSNGVLGDVGIHILDFATFVAGSMPREISCRLKTFHKAKDDQIGEYILDANDSFVMHAELENGALGTVSASRFASGHHNDLRLRLYGDKGGMEVLFEKNESQLNVCLEDDLLTQQWRQVETAEVPSNYERFATAICTKTQANPDFSRGAALQYWLDRAMRDG